MIWLSALGHRVVPHQHARHRSVHTPLPRPGDRDDLTVLELLGVLTQVPDVAGGVLGVPVVGVLDHALIVGDHVVDHDRGDSVDGAETCLDDHLDVLEVTFVVSLIDPARTWGEGPELVGGRHHEAGLGDVGQASRDRVIGGGIAAATRHQECHREEDECHSLHHANPPFTLPSLSAFQADQPLQKNPFCAGSSQRLQVTVG